jgi:antirestriction protein ArdC
MRLRCRFGSTGPTYRINGGQVRKGEKSTEILFTKQHTVKDNQTEVEKRISFLRTYNVFNEDQIDGLPDRGVEILPSVDPIPAVDAFIKAIRANIFIGGNRAFYESDAGTR